MSSPSKTPRWFLAVVIIVFLPVVQFPMLLNSCNPDGTARTLVWLYPLYAATAAYLSYQCYEQRRTLAWILIALMILSHAAIYLLVTTPIVPQ